MIYPDNDYKEGWDLFMALVLIFTCTMTPYTIAFHTVEDFATKVINSTIDILFLIDMIVIFNTAIYNENMRFVTDRKKIAKNYLMGWFTIDLLAIVPFDLMIQSSANNLTMMNMVRAARIGKITRLVKLTRLIRLLKVVKEKSKILKYIGNFF